VLKRFVKIVVVATVSFFALGSGGNPVDAAKVTKTCPYGYYVNIYGLCSPIIGDTIPTYNNYYSTPKLPTYNNYYSTPKLPTYNNYYSTPKPKTYSSYGPSALCRDGSYSYSQSRRGTCSWHGGVGSWLK
jgi:hypothetical protein